MKLYDGGRAPNPRRVTVFLAEKGIEVEKVPVDMGKLGHKSEEVTRLNPLQRLPVLELDDGTAISETVAICRYFEELHPEPPLMGTDARDKAEMQAALSARVSLAEALKAAQAQIDGGKATEAVFSDENGTPGFEVTLVAPDGNEHNLFVDAATGNARPGTAAAENEHGDDNGLDDREEGERD